MNVRKFYEETETEKFAFDIRGNIYKYEVKSELLNLWIDVSPSYIAKNATDKKFSELEDYLIEKAEQQLEEEKDNYRWDQGREA